MKLRLLLAVLALICGGIGVLQAQSVQTYFNLQSYGTVSGGSQITDETGNTTATLSSVDTSLTSSGLSVSSASENSASAGLYFANGAISSLTGSFSIQDWVTVANPNNGVALWGANNGPANTYIGDGYTGVTTLIGFTWGSLTGGGGAGSPTGANYNRYGNNIGGLSLSPGQSYDTVLTYNASTYTYNQYINGVLTSTYVEALGVDSLAGAQYMAIGGCPNEPWSPWGDASADETTSDFLLYNGGLTANQVSALDAAGAGASLDTIDGIIAVPEPGTMALTMCGGLGLLFWRRMTKQA